MAKEKTIKHQKGLTIYNLKDLTEQQAIEKGKIFHNAWLGFHELRKEKNRKLLEKRLAKFRKK